MFRQYQSGKKIRLRLESRPCKGELKKHSNAWLAFAVKAPSPWGQFLLARRRENKKQTSGICSILYAAAWSLHEYRASFRTLSVKWSKNHGVACREMSKQWNMLGCTNLTCPIRLTDKPWLKVSLADLLWEKKYYSLTEKVWLISQTNRATVHAQAQRTFFFK